MTLIMAIRTENGIAIGADKMALYEFDDGTKQTTVTDKIFQIGGNTIMGIAGDSRNIMQLIDMLKQSRGLDKDPYGTIKKAKKEIGKLNLDCGCLICGVSNGKPIIIELAAEKSHIEIEKITNEYAAEGEMGVGFGIINSILYPYLEYAKKVGKELTLSEASFLVYLSIREASIKGNIDIGYGVDIWEIKSEKNDDGTIIYKVPEWKIKDSYETGYNYYKKMSIGAIENAINLANLLRVAEPKQEKEKNK